MDFLASLPGFNADLPARTAFGWFDPLVGTREAICYYKYPIVGVSGKPDLVILARDFEPVVIKVFDYTVDQIAAVDDDHWRVWRGDDQSEIDNPDLVLDDLTTELQTRFDKVRPLRRKLKPQAVAALPLCSEVGVPRALWSRHPRCSLGRGRGRQELNAAACSPAE